MPEQNRFIDSVIRQIEHLPTIPHVVMRVLSVAESGQANAIELSRAMDQSLAATVLKVANSAYYGGRSACRVSSIPRAIVMIGFDALKEIILNTSFFQTLHDSQDIQTLQPLWKHSLQCARIAKRLSWVLRYDAQDEAYFCGLIHDVGKLIIQQYFSDQFRKIEERQTVIEPLEAEREVLGLSHAELGAKMAAQWHFPASIQEAVLRHHDKQWKQNPRLGRILHFSNLFVLGSIDFFKMLQELKEEGMPAPATWDPSDFEAVNQIFQEEMMNAGSILHFSANSPSAPNPGQSGREGEC